MVVFIEGFHCTTISTMLQCKNGHRFVVVLQSSAGLQRSEAFPTACYNLLLDHQGEMYCAIGDMDITAQISVDWVRLHVK